MSYDLYFLARPGSPTPSGEEFRAYFTGRPRYRNEDGQVWYANDDTGVYFCFELVEPDFDPELPAWASFNLNFNRPHFFALEALPEVEAFVAAFGSLVHDPQVDGMGEGAFDAGRFLAGWSQGNAVAVRTLHAREVPPTRPSAELEAMWRWNLGRETLQHEVGEGVFVPSLMYIDGDSGVRSALVWSDAVPILLPRVDSVVLFRHSYAPRRLFRRRPDTVLLDWVAIEPLLQRYPVRPGVLAYREVVYDSPPPDIRSLFADATMPRRPKVIAGDAVLNAELFEREPG